MENSPLIEIEEYNFCGFLLCNGKKLLEQIHQEPKMMADLACQDEELT
jgi:ATP adenylyltransferase/5',5'''-P-1,P-4-tetraphosphate phosphorylase II